MGAKQIGWSNESNLLWDILNQIKKLGGAIANLVTTATPKYKVYTALLTQSGESNVITVGSICLMPCVLNEGVTYYFGPSGETPWDFSNVGGPIFPDMTTFVATSTAIPNDYGDASILYNTGAPVVTVLENTIGNIWFTYVNPGIYYMSSDNLFTNNKTYISNKSVLADDPNIIFGSDYNDAYNIVLVSLDNGSAANRLLNNTPIEIRVYN